MHRKLPARDKEPADTGAGCKGFKGQEKEPANIGAGCKGNRRPGPYNPRKVVTELAGAE